LYNKDINFLGKPQTSNLKPQTSNLKPQTSNLKPQTSNLKPQTSNLKPQTSNLKFLPPLQHQATKPYINLVVFYLIIIAIAPKYVVLKGIIGLPWQYSIKDKV